ncbi:MAG: EamA family transporter [Deltaproteobacteria bacterium]|nr:MAG: EamA family transporter [Deltaproteobacteria bacterium]
MNKEKNAVIHALTAIFIWATIASVFKLTLKYFSPVLMIFYSSAISAVFIFFIAAAKKINVFKTGLKDILFSLFVGFLNPFIYYIILLNAYDLLPAQSAQSLNYTWGITLSIMSAVFLGHKLLKRDYFAIFICYTGVLVIITKGRPQLFEKKDISGIILALSSTIIWASYWIVNTKDKLIPEKRFFFNFLSASFYAFLYLIFTSTLDFNIKGFYGSLYIGIFEMGLSFLLWLSAMKLTQNASRISSMIYLSPVISLFIIKKFVGEKIMLTTIAGLFLIISGLIFQNYKRK